MIKPFPGGLPVQPQEQPPSESKLRVLLKYGSDFNDIVQRYIDQWKLPYEVKIESDGTGTLVNQLSRGEQHLAKFITQETETVEMKQWSSKMAKTPHEVLICGDSGTGKEIIAQSMIGDQTGEIKAVNC